MLQINKELESLVQKGVYEVRKIPPGVKAIPTKLVLRIKLKSDGTVEKYKARCVALGFLQRAGLHYHPDECYSPMSDPSTTRALVAISNALNLNLDHRAHNLRLGLGVATRVRDVRALTPWQG